MTTLQPAEGATAEATPRSLTVIEAVREALREEMQRDERVIVLGEDVGALGGVSQRDELALRSGTAD